MTADELRQIAASLADQHRTAVNDAGGGDGWGGRVNTNLVAPGGPKLYGLAGVDPQQVFNRSSDASVALAQIKQYDPSAYIVDQYGSKVDENGYSGGGDNTEFRIQFDPKKLPAAPKSAGGAPLGNFGGDRAGELFDKGLVSYDKDYGPVMDPRYAKTDKDWLSTVGPAVMAAIATIASGGTLSPIAAAMLNGPSTIGSIADGHPNYGALAGMAGSFLGIPSAVTSAATSLATGKHIDPLAMGVSVAGGAAGIPSWMTQGGMTLAQIARRRG